MKRAVPIKRKKGKSQRKKAIRERVAHQKALQGAKAMRDEERSKENLEFRKEVARHAKELLETCIFVHEGARQIALQVLARYPFAEVFPSEGVTTAAIREIQLTLPEDTNEKAVQEGFEQARSLLREARERLRR